MTETTIKQSISDVKHFLTTFHAKNTPLQSLINELETDFAIFAEKHNKLQKDYDKLLSEKRPSKYVPRKELPDNSYFYLIDLKNGRLRYGITEDVHSVLSSLRLSYPTCKVVFVAQTDDNKLLENIIYVNSIVKERWRDALYGVEKGVLYTASATEIIKWIINWCDTSEFPYKIESEEKLGEINAKI